MPCRVVQNGNTMTIMCSRGSAAIPPCGVAECNSDGLYLCDFTIDDHGCTCDARRCRNHSESIAWGKDYCFQHLSIVLRSAGA